MTPSTNKPTLTEASNSSASAEAKPLSAKPLGYILASLGGLVTAGPLGLVVSPLALLTIAKKCKWDSENKPNRFKTWALVGIIGAPVCGLITFAASIGIVAITAPKAAQSTTDSSSTTASSGGELPTLATVHLKNDSDWPLEKLVLIYPGQAKPFEAQSATTEAHQSSDVLLGNGTMDALPCEMDARIIWQDGDKTDLGKFDFCANSNKTLVVRYPEGSAFE